MATYQAVAVQAISDTLAHFNAWAQAFGGGFTTAGWVAQTGHGEVPATGTGASYAFTTSSLPNTTLAPASGYTFKGAWVSGNTYVGSNALNGAAVDLVTSGGITYAHITATSSSATAPGSDTTNWQPYLYEIWKSAGGQTSSSPIFIRIVYTTAGSFTAGAGSTGPAIHLSIGNAVDANGNLTGTITLSSTAPTTNGLMFVSTAGTASTGDLNFSGDTDNFRFVMWRGLATTNYQWTLCVDRSKTASGTDSDAFSYILFQGPNGTNASSSTQRTFTQVLLKSTLGAPISWTTANAAPAAGLVSNGSLATTMLQFGVTPFFPVFPPVGYLANPLLGIGGFNNNDVSDGQVMPVWIYGSSHNYLVSKANPATGSNNISGVANAVVTAIRWE